MDMPPQMLCGCSVHLRSTRTAAEGALARALALALAGGGPTFLALGGGTKRCAATGTPACTVVGATEKAGG